MSLPVPDNVLILDRPLNDPMKVPFFSIEVRNFYNKKLENFVFLT